MSAHPDETDAPEEPRPDEATPDATEEDADVGDATRDGLAPGERALQRAQPVTDAEPEVVEAVRPDPEDVSLKEPILALLVPVAVIAILSLIRPDIFYDQFVYKYYWEPIVEDSGFTIVNTISWAILMGLLLFLLVRVVQKIGQPVTFALLLAVVPYIMGGSMTRVFEDTGYFVQPLRYFFITPIIYVVITLVAVSWIVIGHLLQRHTLPPGAPIGQPPAYADPADAPRADPERLDAALKALAAFFAVIFIAYAFWANYGDQLADYGNVFVLFFAMAVPLAYFWNHTKQTGRFNQVGVMATFGTAFLLYATYLVATWHIGTQWDPVATDKVIPAAAGSDLRPWVYAAMFVFPALFTGAVYAIAKPRIQSETWAAYVNPVNLLLIFSQMMDATMTALGIDVFGYSEKHVLPEFLIGWMRDNGPGFLGDYPATVVMLTVKLAVALLVVWAIDIYAKRDMERYPDLVGLAKMAIIMVGLAPGTRDAVRLAMDV